MEAEKHVMRAQLRDLMEKQQMEVRRLTEQHNAQMDQIQQDLLGQLQDLKRASAAAEAPRQDAADPASLQRLAELEGWSPTPNPDCFFKLNINLHAVKHKRTCVTTLENSLSVHLFQLKQSRKLKKPANLTPSSSK